MSSRYTEDERVVDIRYNALSVITSFCSFAYGPPLEFLRKPGEMFNLLSNSAAAKRGVIAPERKTRWWICVVEMNILFYQYFGDVRPRYSASVVDCTATVTGDLTVQLLYNDRRRWCFDFQSLCDVNLFVFTITESKKAFEGSSIYFRNGKRVPRKLFF
jgi:hypothetical protein